jgi:tetratricopeptide (TPR) repeat protein
MRRLNLVVLIGLLAVLAVLGTAIHFLRAWQVRRKSAALLELTCRAEAAKDFGRAALALKKYLNIKREDGSAWQRYARIVDQNTPEGSDRAEVYMIHAQALLHNAGDLRLQRRCAELALELQRYDDARSYLDRVYQRATKDSRGEPADAELEDLLGQCDLAQAKFPDARVWFRKAIAHEPRQVATYDRLARMLRRELSETENADRLIDNMVTVNPKLACAYLSRWRYRTDFHLAGAEGDLQRALQLDADDPDVLLAVAGRSERTGDLAGARRYLQKALTLAPKNLDSAVGMAQLELRDGHPDRAEKVLRAAAEANPKRELWYLLTDVLISQNKIVGDGQAKDCLDRLRKSGLRQGYLDYFDAQILLRGRQWSQAMVKIDAASALLSNDTHKVVRLNLMRAECAGSLGLDQERLAALRRAARDVTSAAFAGPALARQLAQAGDLDEALKIHRRLAERRPESRLDVVRLSIRQVLRQPREARTWQAVEEELQQAETALPKMTGDLTLLRCELLAAEGRLDEARTRLESARTRDPRNPRVRAALASIIQSLGDSVLALKILDQADKDIGPNLDLGLARLSVLVRRGCPQAESALTELAQTGRKLSTEEQPRFLEALAAAAYRLREIAPARQSLRELIEVEADNLQVMMALLDLAIDADDRLSAVDIVDRIRRVEGEEGTLWRYGQAVYLINLARRGDVKGLNATETLVSEIVARRQDWWGTSFLQAQIAELKGKPDVAISEYLRSLELGNSLPSLARRLVWLLDQRQDFNQIDRVFQKLQERGVAPDDLASASALSAIRKKDFEGGFALARQAFPATSPRAEDHLWLGHLLRCAGRLEQGGNELRRAVELSPDLPEAQLAYVQHLVQMKQIDLARSAVDAARRALPANQSAGTLAQCCALVGENQRADVLYRTALAEKPDDPATLRAAAGFYADQRLFEQAEQLLTLLTDRKTGASPGDVAWANRTRAMISLNSRRHAAIDQALALIEQNLKANPTGYDDLRLRAVLLSARTSRRQEAIDQLEGLDKTHGLGAEDRFLLACLHNAEGRQHRYRAEMLQLFGAGHKEPRHLAHFIAFLIRRNDLDDAGRWLAALKSQQPEGPTTLELEAYLLKEGKQNQELLRFLQARARGNPAQVGIVARLLDRFGFAREAEEAYKTEIAHAPQETERLLSLASFLGRQNRPAEAIELLEKTRTKCQPERIAMTALSVYDAPSATIAQKRLIEAWIVEAVQRTPRSAGLVSKLAAIRLRQGRYEEARALLRQALTGDPDDPQALNDLAWVLAQGPERLAASQERLKESLSLINRAIDVAGEGATMLDTRAVVYLQLGRVDRALHDLDRALSLRPTSRASYFHLAKARLLANDKSESLKAFAQAEKLGLNSETVDPLERRSYLKLRGELLER